MRKLIKKTITKSIVTYAIFEDGTFGEDLTYTCLGRVTIQHAQAKLSKEVKGTPAQIIVKDVTYQDVTYQMPVERFIEMADIADEEE